MREVPQDWQELLDWFCGQASLQNPPACPPIGVALWHAQRTPAEQAAADAALEHWLVCWEFPPSPLPVQGLVHLRLAFALYALVMAMSAGRPALLGEAQRRGTIHGLVFRNWHSQHQQWLAHYALHWPSLRAMSGGSSN